MRSDEPSDSTDPSATTPLSSNTRTYRDDSDADEAVPLRLEDDAVVRRRRRTRSEIEHDHYQMINDRIVDDITLDFMYKPHTLTVLAIFCLSLLYQAFSSNTTHTGDNMYYGFMASIMLFLVVSALAFPNGPFIRPHPIIWRVIFGCSVVYMIILQFCLFLSYEQIKSILTYFDPVGLSNTHLVEKEYAVNCSDLTFERVWSHMDIFAVGHFMGWTMKAMLIRHSKLCWLISVAWELTEVVFTHLLPNFQECWWDAIGLDILLCNGTGIYFGLFINRIFTMKTFHWESMKDIKTTRGKVKRAVLQFTPASWTTNNWTDVFALKRTIAIFVFVMIWLVTELNTFFLKHIFAIDTSHPVVFWRIILIALISAPSIRQYYAFSTDPRIKRLGMQCWVYCAVCALEASICIKVGRQQFPNTQLGLIALWIVGMFVGTFITVHFSLWWANRNKDMTANINVGGVLRKRYLDSSYENLGILDDEVNERRRDLGLRRKRQ